MNFTYFIIVIYNTKLSNSVAYNNLIKCDMEDYRIIVVDNSVNGIDNLPYCENHERTKLLQMKRNLGLSRGLNVGLDYIKSINPNLDDIIVLLNDDTAITKKFFDVLKASVSSNSADIYAPIMQGQNGVFYSPARQGFFKNHYIKTSDEEIEQKRFFAIMSGTVAKWSLFMEYRFDENIFMDLMDNDFCDYQREHGRTFQKMDLIIQQNYAMKNTGLTMEKVKGRYEIWVPDFLTYCKKKKIRLIGYFPAVAARGVMLSWQCKDVRFWFWVVGYSINCLRK